MRDTALQFGAASFSRRWRELLLIFIALLTLAAMMWVEPIAQSPAYHNFADARAWAGVPNVANIVSNILFLVVGVAGFVFCVRTRTVTASWTVFFLGVALVGVGSSYYHWTPRDETLVWDRLPMTVAFMALFVALLSEHISQRIGRWLLVPALIAGVASVGYWQYANDLRFYVWVQVVPFLIIPFTLGLFRPRFTHRAYLLYGLGGYILAKAAELYDREIFALTSEWVSGHSLKHLLAAFGSLFVYLMLRRRKPV